MQAHGVPIAVPMFCFHQVVPNWKMLLCITSFRSSNVKVGWRSAYFPKVLSYFSMVGIPSEGSMFVYIDIASDVRIFEPGGKGPCLLNCLGLKMSP